MMRDARPWLSDYDSRRSIPSPMGTNYYDVAVLEARENGAYYRTLDKEHRGAVAPGKTVTVSTSAKQAEKARFQMEGSSDVHAWEEPERYYLCKWRRVLFYDAGGKIRRCRRFIKKVAVSVGLTPGVTKFQVVQERTGKPETSDESHTRDGWKWKINCDVHPWKSAGGNTGAAGDGAGDCGSE